MAAQKVNLKAYMLNIPLYCIIYIFINIYSSWSRHLYRGVRLTVFSFRVRHFLIIAITVTADAVAKKKKEGARKGSNVKRTVSYGFIV